jgi:hypothetical protein
LKAAQWALVYPEPASLASTLIADVPIWENDLALAICISIAVAWVRAAYDLIIARSSLHIITNKQTNEIKSASAALFVCCLFAAAISFFY